MILKSLSIKNYCGFTKEQIIEFAEPDGKKAGSGLTLITGESNTGKSTIIRALRGNTEIMSIAGLEEYFGEDGELKLTIGETTYFRKKESESWINKNPENNKQFFEIAPAARNILLETTNVLPFYLGHLHHSVLEWESPDFLIDNLRSILNCDNNKRKFYDIIKKILPEFQGEFDFKSVKKRPNEKDSPSYLTLMYKNDAITHTSRLVSHGILSLVIIASSIVLSAMRKTILVIDEPELHLHPSAQKRLAKLLSQEATNKQIVIITHSPYFIFWEHLKNGAKFLRFNKYNQVCTVHELNHNNLEKIKGYNEPTRYHLFDIAAKEIMFIDKILFVEGQEDTGIIYKWAQEEKRELNFNIFGYGTNGWSNFYIFLEISKQLGIKKVAVLYDKSKPNDTNPERGNIHLDDDLEQNRKEYKDYRFYQLETTDIIGKKDGKVNKEGIFDETGNLRKECSAHFEKIISDLNEYFSQ